jgi:ubiquinone/menaquinone biosynthesis C-methylase UbiE
MSFDKTSYAAHENLYETEKAGTLFATWMKEGTVDAWRHAQMYECLDPLLAEAAGANWLTVGDGRCGTDAHYLEQHGMKVLASDISDTMLKVAQAAGFIQSYKKENAERLSFEDNSFDYVLCKEAYHHFPRPMVALYEMLRVGRKGVVLIEPDDSPVLVGDRRVVKMIVKESMIRLGFGRLFGDRRTDIIDSGSNWYEEAGNYGYAISKREIEKVAMGLDLPQVAFKGINDVYVDGVEHEALSDDSKLLQKIKEQIHEMDREVDRGLSRGRPKLLVAMIFKEPISEQLRGALISRKYDVRDLPRNPHGPWGRC